MKTGDDGSRTATSWVSACPGGLWEVHRSWIGERKQGSCTPVMGSLCKIRVWPKTSTEQDTSPQNSDETELPADTNVQATPYPRSQDSVLQVPLHEWFLLRMGEGQCDITEGCLEGMRAGERCEIMVRPLTGDSQPKCDTACGSQAEMKQEGVQAATPLCFTLLLHSFTTGQETWEMTPGEKWIWVKSHKERGGQRFGKGDIWGATDCYCRAVKLVITLKGHTKEKGEREKDMREGQEREGGEDKDAALALQEGDGENEKTNHGVQNPNDTTNSDTCSSVTFNRYEAMELYVPTEEEYKTMKAELHSNLSLCQLRLGQPEKARDSGIKATQLDPTSTKAWYRLGQANQQIGELGEARRAYGRVLELQPDSAAARKALKQVISMEKELDNKLGQRLSKMFK